MIFFNIQRRNEHKEMKPYANKLQGRLYMCRRFYDGHRSPKTYRHSACLHDTRRQQSTYRTCMFPLFFVRLHKIMSLFGIFLYICTTLLFEMFTTFSRKLEKFKYRCMILFNTLCDTVRDKIYSDALKKQI